MFDLKSRREKLITNQRFLLGSNAIQKQIQNTQKSKMENFEKTVNNCKCLLFSRKASKIFDRILHLKKF